VPDAPDPFSSPEGDAEDSPGVRDDTAPGDDLVEGFRAVKDTPPAPGGSDIAADDAGGTAMAEQMGDTTRKG
jgi:hypothetical protein